jgi:hypothetical protein
MPLPYVPCPPEMHGVLLPSGSTFFLPDEGQWPRLADAAAGSDQPWMVLLEALRATREGDFDPMVRLLPSAAAFPYADYANACSVLLGAAAPAHLLEALTTVEALQVAAASAGLPAAHCFRALTMTHQLWAAQRVLSQLDVVRLREDRHGLVLRCARILDASSTYIDDDDAALKVHTNRLRALAMALSEAGASGDVALLGGEPLTLAAVVDRMLMIIRSTFEVDFALYRLTFEAYTGIDCRHFYVDDRLQKLAAAATLEAFLESGEVDKYEPGVRYFFGHRIPD